MPNLRATTSKVVTHAMITNSHPDTSAIRSSSRRRPSDIFNSAFIVSALRATPAPRHFPSCGGLIARRTIFLTHHHGKPRQSCAPGTNLGPRGYPDGYRAAWKSRSTERSYLAAAWAGAAPSCAGARSLFAEVGGLQRLRFAPDGVLLAEVEVVVGDLLECRVLCRLCLEYVEPRLLEGGQVLVTPALDLNLVLVAHLGHGLELHGLGLGEGDDHLRLARDLDHRLVGGGQLVVSRLVHQELAARHLLVPAREVVELGDLVEAELDVHHRHRELGGVDHAAFERRIDVGRGQQLRGDAELLHHLR